MTYVVCGTTKVAGKSYGEKLSADDLAGVNVAALIEGGHIKPQPEGSKPAKQTPSSAADADADKE